MHSKRCWISSRREREGGVRGWLVSAVVQWFACRVGHLAGPPSSSSASLRRSSSHVQDTKEGEWKTKSSVHLMIYKMCSWWVNSSRTPSRSPGPADTQGLRPHLILFPGTYTHHARTFWKRGLWWMDGEGGHAGEDCVVVQCSARITVLHWLDRSWLGCTVRPGFCRLPIFFIFLFLFLIHYTNRKEFLFPSSDRLHHVPVLTWFPPTLCLEACLLFCFLPRVGSVTCLCKHHSLHLYSLSAAVPRYFPAVCPWRVPEHTPL